MIERNRSTTLLQLVRQTGEGTKLSQVLNRISDQYGAHLTVSPEAMALIETIRQNGDLDKKAIAQLFNEITKGNGTPGTHMSGYKDGALKPKTLVGRKKLYRITFL